MIELRIKSCAVNLKNIFGILEIADASVDLSSTVI